MKNEKYIMFKNFLHNELGITREDIQEWIQDAIREETKKVINKTFADFDIEREARRAISDSIYSGYSNIRKEIIESAAREVLSQLDIQISKK